MVQQIIPSFHGQGFETFCLKYPFHIHTGEGVGCDVVVGSPEETIHSKTVSYFECRQEGEEKAGKVVSRLSFVQPRDDILVVPGIEDYFPPPVFSPQRRQ